MKSYVSPDQVIADLGDKVTDGLRNAVAGAARDLARYRKEHPDWVSGHTDRGLANWIHDRAFAHLVAELYGIPPIEFVDNQVRREMWVGPRYQVRIKRHHDDGAVAFYPTQAALDFTLQPPTLPGLELVRLMSGYEWDGESRTIGAPVLSLRDGRDNVIWMYDLTALGGGATPPTPITGPASGPATPSIVLQSDRDKSAGEGEVPR